MNRNCYYCQLCINSLAYSSFDSLYLHINAVHGKSPSFKLRCELTPLCGSIYRTFASYKTHIYKYHRKLISESNDKEDVPSCSHHASNNEFQLDNDNQAMETEENNDDNENFPSPIGYDDEVNIDDPLLPETMLEHEEENFDLRSFQKHYTGFLLELRERHMLTQNIIISITINFSKLLNIVSKIIATTGGVVDATTTTTVVPMVKIEEIINQF
jgi:hypothetical protein